MIIYSYVNKGYLGELVKIEIDLRRGIPGFDIVGLPDSAVRESRERVRAALRNSGYTFPKERVLVNLAPADLKKEGSLLDLPIALAIISAQSKKNLPLIDKILVVGELELSGIIRGAKGVPGAIYCAKSNDIPLCIIPEENILNKDMKRDAIISVSSLAQAGCVLEQIGNGASISSFIQNKPNIQNTIKHNEIHGILSIDDIKGQEKVKRAMLIAAAGRHHMLLFGPPGVGKTLAANSLQSISAELSMEKKFEVERIYALVSNSSHDLSNIMRIPARSPHHSISKEGMLGGGAERLPGEISLSHNGILILDEVSEFKKNVIQGLREPMEKGFVEFIKSGRSYLYPADFQLILTLNPCPCGKLGWDSKPCQCTPVEIHNYWKKIGSALLDRIDIRVPVEPIPPHVLIKEKENKLQEYFYRVQEAITIQNERYRNVSFKFNNAIPAREIDSYCKLDKNALECLKDLALRYGFSARAIHSIQKLARTIADLEQMVIIQDSVIIEAVGLRQYGEGDYYWKKIY